MDVSYTYTPIFGRFVNPSSGTVTFSRTAMLMPRTFQPQPQPAGPPRVPPGQAKKGAGPGPQSQGAIYYNDPSTPTPDAVCPGYYYTTSAQNS